MKRRKCLHGVSSQWGTDYFSIFRAEYRNKIYFAIGWLKHNIGIIKYIMNDKLCEYCPLAENLSLVQVFPENMRWRVREIIENSPWNELYNVIMCLSAYIFQGNSISGDTALGVHQHIRAIFELGIQRGGNCSVHHLENIYRKRGIWPFCMRKYLLEEVIKFFQDLWRESKYNEEQFQALLADRWPVFWLSLTC